MGHPASRDSKSAEKTRSQNELKRATTSKVGARSRFSFTKVDNEEIEKKVNK